MYTLHDTTIITPVVVIISQNTPPCSPKHPPPRLLIVAGDPQQLPPVVATPAHLTTTPPNTDTQHPAHHGIARPLFERLATTGQQVVLLDTQYRCHPTIAEIVNQCFYGGRLLHGCTAEQRPPLVEGLPPLLWLDVQGQEQGSGGVLGGGGGGGGNTSTTHTSAGGSLSNSQEAAVVGQLLRILVGVAGLDVGQCGVIACYKRQVACIEGYVGGGAQAGVQVATVDSFQVGMVCLCRHVCITCSDSWQPLVVPPNEPQYQHPPTHTHTGSGA